jgi:hypothetical protein
MLTTAYSSLNAACSTGKTVGPLLKTPHSTFGSILHLDYPSFPERKRKKISKILNFQLNTVILKEEERMLTITENAETLKNKIKDDLDILDMDELQRIYRTIATIAAEKAIKLADRDWMEKGLSRVKIEEEVKMY